MKKSLKIIAAFAMGATAGTVLGMLLMPEKEKADESKSACRKAADDKRDHSRHSGQMVNDNAYTKAEAARML